MKLLILGQTYWTVKHKGKLGHVVHWNSRLSFAVACVASVAIWFRSKERPVLAAREMKREPNNEPPLRSFTCAIFRAVFDFRSSFFAPKPRGNACYAGYFWRKRDPTLNLSKTSICNTNEWCIIRLMRLSIEEVIICNKWKSKSLRW